MENVRELCVCARTCTSPRLRGSSKNTEHLLLAMLHWHRVDTEIQKRSTTISCTASLIQIVHKLLSRVRYFCFVHLSHRSVSSSSSNHITSQFHLSFIQFWFYLKEIFIQHSYHIRKKRVIRRRETSLIIVCCVTNSHLHFSVNLNANQKIHRAKTEYRRKINSQNE